MSYLAWTAEWYFRPEILEAANAAVVNYHHRPPLTRAFGSRTLSSSDGQRFPVNGKSITARHLSRYFARGPGVSTYTHVCDQHSTFDTKVIVATAPESHYVLDGLLGNETDLPTFEHATDTHGATLANFALFDTGGRPAPVRLAVRRRDPGAHLADPPRERALLRHPFGRHDGCRPLRLTKVVSQAADRRLRERRLLLRVAAHV
nr:transposase [Planosporangium mesophilum]